MKKIWLGLISLFAFHLLNAQSSTIDVPAAPAYSILSATEPSSVLRPSNFKDLSLDVLNSFDKDGKLKPNLGIEFAPYWLKSNPSLSRSSFLNPTFWQGIKQSFQISLATNRDSISNTDKLGAGIRFHLLNGRPSDEFNTIDASYNVRLTISASINQCLPLVDDGTLITTQGIIDKIQSIMKAVGNDEADITAITAMADKLSKEYNITTPGKTELKSFVTELNKNVLEASLKIKNKLIQASKIRKGIIAEVAFAGSFYTNTNKQRVDRFGFWLNAGEHASETDSWNFSFRTLFANKDTSITNSDLGVSYTKELKQFAISFETMARWYRAEIPDKNISGLPITRVEKNFTYRLSLQTVYKINENISLNYSVGKGFEDPVLKSEGFFSVLGLRYNILKPVNVPVK